MAGNVAFGLQLFSRRPDSVAGVEPEVEVRDVPKRSRYEAILPPDQLAGFAEYRDIDGVRVFTHTEVFDELEGQGIGSALARGALDEAQAAGRAVEPRCPFIRAYIERHPEYAELNR